MLKKGGDKVAEEKKNKKYVAGGLMIPAGLLVGMGIGGALDYLVAGALIGLGAGFLLFGIIVLIARD